MLRKFHFDVIRSFDRPLIHSELLEKMADKNVKTELDWQLYQLQRRYLDYQVNIGNRIIECLTSGNPEDQMRAAQMSYPKKKFQDLMDDLFGETGKKIIRQSNEILFEQDGDTLYLTNFLRVKNRYWLFCLLSWYRTRGMECCLWMSLRFLFMWSGNNVLFH